ncbi:MAG TPA: right-handed parallel beta-helix repeat-containing protein, partial [Acidimicrobiales bacterium]|nr:right-handed parallel beta-helix repeat-containing protein [Acidimicrobiales bacterium]
MAVASYLAAALVLVGAGHSRAVTYVVTSTADSGDGSLRQAIVDVNAGLIDRIEFQIATGATSVPIVLASPLDAIVRPVTIDATTQSAYPSVNRPVIEVRGPLAVIGGVEQPSVPGLIFDDGSSGSLVRGLSLTQFAPAVVAASTGVRIQENWIGLGTDIRPRPNITGVFVNGSVNTVGPGNLISYNEEEGVRLSGDDNIVIGNQIGTDPSGAFEGGNAVGIRVGEGANRNTIGGTGAGERNVISGNVFEGVRVEFASGTVIIGNYIGTNALGTARIGNTTGIALFNSPSTIGGTAPGAGNVVSGNVGPDTGISVDGSDGTAIQGNFIGTNAAGSAVLGNDGGGISLASGSNYQITGNLISGNGSFEGDSDLVFVPDPGIEAADVTDLTIQGNRIGTNAAGDNALPNSDGIALSQTARVRIGGTGAGEGNLISGNALSAVHLDCGASSPEDTTIQGNLIGTDASGTAAVPNEGDGVEVSCGEDTLVGGTDPGAGNVISGNLGHGVFDQGTDDVIQANRIGVGVTGGALPNGGSGVYLDSSGPQVGGDEPEAGNIIAFNLGDGVSVLAGTGNPVRLNSIHDNAELGIDLNDDGILNGNDPGDPDLGANLTQNYPVLTSAAATGGVATITGVLDTQAGTYAVDFYGNTPGDVEGETYLGTVTVVVDAAPASFTAPNIPVSSLQRLITATATEVDRLDTSEFSPPVLARFAPMLTTQASPSVPVGGQIFDTATLTGDIDPTGSLVFRLYGPGDPTCAGPPVAVLPVPLAADQFVYQSPSVTTMSVGTYRWVAEYLAGAGPAVTTPCDDPAESVVVTPAAPTITTQASPSVGLGGSVTDTATLIGGFNPTGTVTFNLYGPADATCAGVPVFTSVRPLVGGAATSESFIPTAPGTYRWVAAYSGDAN